MIGGILQTAFLAGGIGDAFNSLANAGFFTYALPFLLIFALIFGILTRMKLFTENRAVVAIISLAVALMALSVPTVPQFFSQIFPSMGIALSILLAALIIVGFFADASKPWVTISLFVVAAIAFVAVIVSSSGIDVGLWIQGNLGDTAGTLVIIAIVIVVIAVIIGRRKTNPPTGSITFNPPWASGGSSHP